jgi:hypothetical protein
MCKLQSNDWVLNQLLAECFALVGVFYRLLEAHPRESYALNDDTDPLVVEVGHDDYGMVSSEDKNVIKTTHP